MSNTLQTISGDSQITQAIADQIKQICESEHIPVSGITVLGGKPYINTTGLDSKIKYICENENLVVIDCHYEPDCKATKESQRAGGLGVIKLFDERGFQKALQTAAANTNTVLNTELIKELKSVFVREFRMRGFASPDTLKMSTMKNLDNIEMMAERRATNRAKREATGTGLTSLDEVDGIVNGDQKPVNITPGKTEKPKFTDESVLSKTLELALLKDCNLILAKSEVPEWEKVEDIYEFATSQEIIKENESLTVGHAKAIKEALVKANQEELIS